MANQFLIYGKISPIKETEKFKPIDRNTYESSKWTNTNVRFNVISNTNRIMCMTQGGKYIDDAKNIVKTFGKDPDANGKRPMIEIPWAKRLDQDQIDKVAGFRHFVVDLDNRVTRSNLVNLVKAFEKGEVTDEMINETGYDTLEAAKEALEKSNKRKHTFITEWDFAEYMAKVVVSDKIKGKIFRITGTQEIQYSKGKFYSNYKINRVELANDAEMSAAMNVDFFFADDCIDEEDGIARINGWSTYYDSGLKKSGFYPMCIVSRGGEKEIKGLKRKLSVGECEIANIGLVVNIIDGAEVLPITYDDLSDEDKADIDDGFITLEEIQRASNGGKIGDRITELRYSGLNPRKRTVEDTTYTVEDMHPAVADVADVEDDDDDDI